jgi:hypothetical protein
MLLLSPSALMSITLSTCLCLTNHVFQKITEFNAFPNFRYFGVISNSGITKEGIDTLMQGSPSQSDEADTLHQSDEKEYGRLEAAADLP